MIDFLTRDSSVEKRDSAVRIWNVSSSSSSSSIELPLPRRPPLNSLLTFVKIRLRDSGKQNEMKVTVRRGIV